MNFEWEALLNIENWNEWLNQYAGIGPFPGIALPMLEAFLPFLPLIAIVMANAAAYGLWWGLFYSWIGSTFGAIVVFFFFRLMSKKRMKQYLERYPKVNSFFEWIERRGFTPILLMYSLPFAPSSIVNVAAGISTISIRSYLFAVALGKGVMVFIISFLGHDLESLVREPWRMILAIAILALMWVGGKFVENRYTNVQVKPSGSTEEQ